MTTIRHRARHRRTMPQAVGFVVGCTVVAWAIALAMLITAAAAL